jgi:REP element-mobilizing transposase RayT
MPRRLRIHVPGAFYHVTLRGNHRQLIFFCEDDRQLLGDIVAATIERFPARVHAYCWMSNHIHLLIQAGDMPIGRVILRIASRYARAVQARLSTTGHLFERRYHSVMVDADRYLLAVLRYVHLNPVRAGLVAEVCDYPWSSHHVYAGTRSEPWVTTDFALRLWGPSRAKAVAGYRAFMEGPHAADISSPFSNVHPDDSRILGDDEFRKSLGVPIGLARSNGSLSQLIEEACRTHEVELDDLVSGIRQRRLTTVRAWIAHQAVARRIASISEVARHLHRDESSLRELVARHHPSYRR